MAGIPSRWLTWEQLLERDAGVRLFGEGFHSSVAQIAPGLFLPLVATLSRLFDGPEQKSVAFSAGMELDVAAGRAALGADLPLPPMPSQALLPHYTAAFAALDAPTRTRTVRTARA